MDFETTTAEDFGASLTGLGINILTRDVRALSAFLVEVFEMTAHRISDDFAIMTYGGQVFQLHGDHTYHSHPLPSLLPEAGARGAGIELRLYGTDPDDAAVRAKAFGATVLQAPENKPHGLRECVILSDEGYAWLPSRALSDEEAAAVG
ncbi:glyoxalase [Aliiroseovarius subalbicans]|uniref:VOC family protein n=1 Tax=Aliiroseovarius subalbicans TaxID=2925840 RepID=UPI001F55B6AA|nr:glyoxalase [Aliiroseovarius subalbicans]MCI2400497.1 glyoxalase [Aliiroseovarius subalbicans]